MDIHQNMSGRYWQTCSREISASPGWLKRVMTLGLLNLIPIFGQIVTLGFSCEWAHKAAWGISSPLPDKIFGRPQSKMLRWGVFALVITLLFTLVPQIVSSIGDVISVSNASSFWQHTTGTGAVGIIRNILALVVGLCALALMLLSIILFGPALMRMVAYDDITAGLQLKADWKMFAHDIGGILRIVGMTLLFSCIAAIFVFVFVFIFAFICIFMAVFSGAATSMLGSGGMSGFTDITDLAGIIAAVGIAASPLVIVATWVLSSFLSWMNLLVMRAYGHWAAQFDLASWGAKDEPMPFECDAYQDVYAEHAAYAERPAYAEAHAAEPQTAGAPDAQAAEAPDAPDAQSAEPQSPDV